MRLSAMLLVGAAAQLSVAAPAASPGPRPGVYACYGQYGLSIPMQFGIVDAATYKSYDGKRGRYALVGDVLTMTSGPLAGIKYKRTASQPKDVFRMLDQRGALTAYNCPSQPGNAARGHW